MSKAVDRQRQAQKLAQFQHGAISRQQLLMVGWSDSMIREQITAMRWRRILAGVYVVFTGELTLGARLWSGHLYAGEGSYLRGETALSAWGIGDAPASPIRLWVPPTKTLTSTREYEFSRDFQSRQRRTPQGLPPASTVEVALLDVSDCLDDELRIAALVTGACQSGKTTASRIAKSIRHRSRLRHRKLLTELLAEVAGGANSVLEVSTVKNVLGAHGLPVGTGQVRERQGSGVVYRDLVLPYGVVVELNGRRGHADPHGQLRDRIRDNAVTVSGRRTLRYGWHEVKHSPCAVAAEIAYVLTASGWQGTLQRCSPGCAAV